MFFDFEELGPKDRYKLITATVVPRPIALVTTRNENDSINSAPFSYFNVYSEELPLVVFGVSELPPGHSKGKHLHDIVLYLIGSTVPNRWRVGWFFLH
jgi:flavin reductase (DIM6/NTAB) family NADH-FMN oxidoreductase RutF